MALPWQSPKPSCLICLKAWDARLRLKLLGSIMILDNCILHVCRELQNAELKEKDSAASHRLERPRFRYVMKHKSLRYKSIVYNIIHLRDTMS